MEWLIQIMDRHSFLFIAMLFLIVTGVLSCGSSGNPNIGRVLTSIAVTPASADAQNFTNAQVTFTANGTFSLPPTAAPVTFVSPYAGQFVVSNPTNSTIASIIDTGKGTITVQCAAGASGMVEIVANASANNGTTIMVSGSATLTCP